MEYVQSILDAIFMAEHLFILSSLIRYELPVIILLCLSVYIYTYVCMYLHVSVVAGRV